MKSVLLFVFCLMAVMPAHAEVLGAIGTNVNYALSANGRTYEKSQPLSVRAGYRFSFADLLVEGSYVNSSSGAGLVTIGLENYEFLGWVRKSLRTGWLVEPFVGLGGGTHFEVVSTKFANETSRDSGGLELVGAAAGGLQFLILRNIELSVEARATTAASYAPNPMLGFAGFLGVVF